MPLSMPEIMVGAQVAVAFDDRGRQLPVQRKGWIVKVVSGDRTKPEEWVEFNDNSGIAQIWVQFSPDEKPELVENRHLAVIRRYDAVAEGRRKAEEATVRGEEKLRAQEPAVIVDRTGLDPNASYSEHNLPKAGKRK